MPEEKEQKTLYIFIDESGNFDFTPNGTKYFVLTSVSTTTPLKGREHFLRLRYELLEKGVNEEYFHATEDRQGVRNLVFEAIKQLDDIEIDAIVAQKNKTNPSLYIQYTGKPNSRGGISFKAIHSSEKFYDKISQMLLKYVCNRYHSREDIGKIVVVLGSLLTKKKRGYVLGSLKQYLKNEFQKPFFIYFHNTASDINCQIADYCGWAVYVAEDRGEKRPLAEIENKIKSCFDVFAIGKKEYYVYKK